MPAEQSPDGIMRERSAFLGQLLPDLFDDDVFVVIDPVEDLGRMDLDAAARPVAANRLRPHVTLVP